MWKQCGSLSRTLYSTAMECLGPSNRRHRDWFDENHAGIMDFIRKKCAAHLTHLHDPQFITKKGASAIPFSSSCAKCKIPGWALELMKSKVTQTRMTWKTLQQSEGGLRSPLLSVDGTKLISKNKILERWAEHFDSVLNRPSSKQGHWTTSTSPVNESLNVTPTLEEVQIAVH